MSDQSNQPDASAETTAPPLKGFLVSESEDEVRVKVTGGTWTFRRGDVARISAWEGDFELDGGRPVAVDIRSGALGEFTQSIQIEVTDRPITLPDEPFDATRNRELSALAASWAADMSLDLAYTVADVESYTYCETNNGYDGTACDCVDME
ncbi:MAG: hypothetical protein JO236_06220 [Mycobacterium sp.]|uniref:hypothetical protein n=1 Tax=Mycobacterium sp. TaxID=1785 RepID=UPI001ECB93C3|nr:hypothetical protein [Mycobacterium sp.]MBW0017126.1 hypothetical protein [Mycobacterium sp.]